MAKKYFVPGFTRKGGEKVKGHYRHLPEISRAERARRAKVAKKRLLPAGVRAAGKRGFYGTVKKLRRHEDHIKTPKKLAGYLKGRAKAKGVLSRKHPYVGRKGYRKYPKAAGRMSKTAYRRYLRRKRA